MIRVVCQCLAGWAEARGIGIVWVMVATVQTDHRLDRVKLLQQSSVHIIAA